MAEYIDRDAFLAGQRHLFCDNCEKRKGMKNGKIRFLYGIGDAPCRACDIEDVLDNVEDFPAADVVERKKGKWIKETNPTLGACLQEVYICSVCGVASGCQYSVRRSFCPNCGADMREDGET